MKTRIKSASVAVAAPNTYRVSYIRSEDDYTQVEVVCTVRVHPENCTINYLHHLQRNRSTPRGNWEKEIVISLPVTPSLKQEIEVFISHELISEAGIHIVTATGEGE